MQVYLGADHRGFLLKKQLLAWLSSHNVQPVDVGAYEQVATDDYVGYAYAVAKAVQEAERKGIIARGIVCCGSGIGVEMVAGKVRGIRCGLGFSSSQVKAARADDDITVLAVPADFVSVSEAKQLVKVFLETPFSKAERHVRRLEKLDEIEYLI